MDNTQLQYIKIQSQYIDKLEQFEKCIIKAAKAAHSLADTAEKKCGQAWAALESGNMDVMRNTIQQYISRYGQDWARFRGVQIQRIDGYTYYCPSLPWPSAQACQRTYTAKKSG